MPISKTKMAPCMHLAALQFCIRYLADQRPVGAVCGLLGRLAPE